MAVLYLPQQRQRYMKGEKVAAIANGDAMEANDKSESEAKGDIVMKEKRLISKLPEASNKRRKYELSFEKLPNFPRIIPAQLTYITFTAESRFKPVRPVSTQMTRTVKGMASTPSAVKICSLVQLGVTSECYAGGGGTLILIDQPPDEPAEYIEVEIPAPVPPVEATVALAPAATVSAPTGPHIALDEDAPETDPPESFEIC
ncbi:hypothetical protein DFH11DRAFT_1558341 [Phellopilus nigrolimitatus]|nr:hypothetical protein DFH11DRAFT_1558341 [Phellopilus nigrolimitatus]